MKKIALLFFAVMLSCRIVSFAAVGCDLNDPDRDVARLYPGSAGYRTVYLSIKQAGGEAMLARVEKRLGDKFSGLFETIDVPYTLYEIQGPDRRTIGYIHGVNQKGSYGGIQVFLALDSSGTIKSFYFQKLTSRQAKELRSPEFGTQFRGLALKDFESYDVPSGKAKPGTAVAALKNPAPEAVQDFKAALRAVKKNLILLDEFVFSVSTGGKKP